MAACISKPTTPSTRCTSLPASIPRPGQDGIGVDSHGHESGAARQLPGRRRVSRRSFCMPCGPTSLFAGQSMTTQVRASDALAAERETLKNRRSMQAFTGSRALRKGDVVQVAPHVPHSLQQGVQVFEFQTPTYERNIISFNQKVLTQDHWDSDYAIEQRCRWKLPPRPTSNQLPSGHLERALRADRRASMSLRCCGCRSPRRPQYSLASGATLRHAGGDRRQRCDCSDRGRASLLCWEQATEAIPQAAPRRSCPPAPSRPADYAPAIRRPPCCWPPPRPHLAGTISTTNHNGPVQERTP